jgi:S1-C subfamily serine protease
VLRPVFTETNNTVALTRVELFSGIVVHSRQGNQPATIDVQDIKNPQSDLAVLKTTIKSPCFLRIGNAGLMKIGANVLSIGLPALAGDLVLYDGFLSASYPHPPVLVGTTDTGKPVTSFYNVLRIQMPITPGVSGAPLINDSDEVVGVMSEVTALWTKNLDDAMSLAGMKGGPSGVSMTYGSGRSLDFVSAIGDLATVVRLFESPGSAYAVPLYYLKLQPGTQQQAQSNH